MQTFKGSSSRVNATSAVQRYDDENKGALELSLDGTVFFKADIMKNILGKLKTYD